MFTHKVVKSVAEVTPSWEELFNESETVTVFQTRKYLQVWVSRYIKNEEVFIWEIYDNEKLIAVAPLRKVAGKITFLGTDSLPSGDLVTDFGDLVIQKSYEEKVWKYLIDNLKKENCKMIFDYLRENSVSFKFLKGQNFKIEQMLDATHPDVAPFMILPTSYEEYLSKLDRKSRHELKRKLRRLEAEGYEFIVSQTPSLDLAEFVRLHKASTEAKDEFMTPQMEQFFTDVVKELSKDNLVEITLLKIKGVNVAATFAFLWKNEYWLYNSGFDRNHNHLAVGLLLKALTIKNAIERKFALYNFLRGNERYKYDLGAKDEGLFKVIVE